MDKLKMHSPNLTEDSIAKLAELFPSCVTEARDEQGRVKQAIDFDHLRQELSDHIVEGPQERYHLNWPGKREALLAANAPIAKTLRPCREESVDFDTTKNLFIEGDNLEALKLLQETYLGKVKAIYIDPPYNTGSDFVYNDRFSLSKGDYDEGAGYVDDYGNRLVANPSYNGRFHSDWLSMVYPRLRLARNLLRSDGVIFISIDDGEQASLRKLCDEVFGEDNFVECFIWKKSYGGGPKEKYAVTQHEYILMYARDLASLPPLSLPYDKAKVERYYKGKDRNFEVRGPYRLKPLEATKSMDPRPNLVYSVELEDGRVVNPRRQWLWSKERVMQALAKDEVAIIERDGEVALNYKQYLKDESGVERGEKPFSVIDGIYTQHGTKDLGEAFNGKVVLQFPKPVELIGKLLLSVLSGSEDEVVLDFFAGSATTAEACFDLHGRLGSNVNWVLVQIPETCEEGTTAYKAGYKNIAEIAKDRVRRAGKKFLDNNGASQRLDVGFRVMKIDSSNMRDTHYSPGALSQDLLSEDIENIREGRSSEDLLFQVLLDWGVDLSLPISRKEIDRKTVFFVDGAEKHMALAACFDLDIDEAFVKQLAEYEPLRMVFRDAGFASDSVKINVEQIFAQKSPNTDVKVI
ncbi:site-specific DNA-methyltransferase [Salinicola sp. DM10]|uniref:site-specific DNA-methyltransferase n=1 Tax=Salinicola sp. DM10 TaxID=2815721 RepID=UPI001A8DB770|nr:site-specific DNA-methyltransferase [Salinicola sp. DM10]MCE3027281.1 site-specific DNA-methyltransferase [Salinicola sp. DM10]